MTKQTTGNIPEQYELTSSDYLQFIKLYIPTDSDPLVQRFCLSGTVEWDGHIWTKAAFSISGVGENGNDEKVRPKLVLPNPDGIYNYYIQRQYLEAAEVTYYRVHPDDIETSQAEEFSYFINRVVENTRIYVNCQLSALSDGNDFKLPSRRFIQPEFNQVRI
ncbi:MAG: hypothetical protein JKY54_13150 [Flavobacteriales bacterium]|uniref:hypothetical protein n=1 Tax=Pseudoalteromonas sp. TaxID=53249 RepID=UPI001A39AEC1|nr:hypothetical protein [Pseudoalteromonas sp.]MBL4705463.1 hypothetical protein [Flavobacteriales bacterium]